MGQQSANGSSGLPAPHTVRFPLRSTGGRDRDQKARPTDQREAELQPIEPINLQLPSRLGDQSIDDLAGLGGVARVGRPELDRDARLMAGERGRRDEPDEEARDPDVSTILGILLVRSDSWCGQTTARSSWHLRLRTTCRRSDRTAPPPTAPRDAHARLRPVSGRPGCERGTPTTAVLSNTT